jgi:hypothetical protein
MISLEDYRYATLMQVTNYTADERCLNPHLTGFDLTQLVDWFNFVAATKKTAKLSLGFYGTFGVCRYLVDYRNVYYPRVNLRCSVESASFIERDYRRLVADNSNFELRVQPDSGSSLFDGCELVIFAYAQRKFADTLKQQLRAFTANPTVQIAVADVFKQYRTCVYGRYYMGSNIWITDSAELSIHDAS